jgi:outer membrane lipoprotein-sorting protein
MKLIKNIFLSLCFFNVVLFAQSITTDEIIRNIKLKSTEINDYIVDAEANINLENLRAPKAKIKVYFKQPDQFHYDSKSSAILPKTGFNFNLSNLLDNNFNIKLLKEETIDNTNVYMLELKPKNSDTGEIDVKTYLWVDKKNWVMKRMFNESSNLVKMIVDCSYSYIDNKYYMPSLIKYTVEPIADTENESSKDNANTSPQEAKKGRRGRAGFMSKGDITITFKNYIINSNFSDDIFKEENEK